MKEITVQQLKEKFDKKEDFQLIDVREAYEYELVNIGGELIPLHAVLTNADKISKDKTVVFYCRSGSRSKAAISALENQFGFQNLYNLKGGIMAYAIEIDTSLPTY
jgi:rhodanese-related sulfurtransferase